MINVIYFCSMVTQEPADQKPNNTAAALILKLRNHWQLLAAKQLHGNWRQQLNSMNIVLEYASILCDPNFG